VRVGRHFASHNEIPPRAEMVQRSTQGSPCLVMRVRTSGLTKVTLCRASSGRWRKDNVVEAFPELVDGV